MPAYGLTYDFTVKKSAIIPGLLAFLLLVNSCYAVVVPANIIRYLPITIFNYQNSPVESNTPIAIGVANAFNPNGIEGFPANTYSMYFTANMNNYEFFDSGGNVLYSWNEGNAINEMAWNGLASSPSSANAPSSTTNDIIWVKSPFWNDYLTANAAGQPTYETIYLGWTGTQEGTAAQIAQNDLMTGTAGFTGQAPQLSCDNGAASPFACKTYGIYDNGNSLFSLYSNWTSTPTGLCTSISNWACVATSDANILVDNGIRFITSNVASISYAYITYNTATNEYFSNSAVDGFATYNFFGVSSSSTELNFNPAFFVSSNIVTSVQDFGYAGLGGPTVSTAFGTILHSTTPSANALYSQVGAGPSATADGNLGTFPMGVISTSESSLALSALVNYSNRASYATVPPNTVVLLGSFQTNGDSSNSVMNLQWTRVRISPPNGILPSTVYGPVIIASNITAYTSTQSFGTNTLYYDMAYYLNVLENPPIPDTYNVVVSGGIFGSNNNIYSQPGGLLKYLINTVIPAGSQIYTINVFDVNTMSVIATNTFTIVQSPIKMYAAGGLSPFPYAGYNEIIKEIQTSIIGNPILNNQVTFNVFINNALSYSYTTTNFIQVPVAPGTYTITANTLGNGNYLPASITNTVTVTNSVAPTLSIPYNPMDVGSPATQNVVATDRVQLLNISNAHNSYIISNAPYFSSSDGYTISLWYQWRGIPSNTPLACANGAAHDECIYLTPYFSNTIIGISTNIDNGEADYIVHGIVVPQNMNGNWINLQYVITAIDPVAYTLYLDGSSVPVNTYTGASIVYPPLSSYWYLGDYSDTSNAAIPGNFTNIQFYDTDFTPAMALQLYSEGIHGTPTYTPNLTAWWPLNGTPNAEYFIPYNTFGRDGLGSIGSNAIFSTGNGPDVLQLIFNNAVQSASHGISYYFSLLSGLLSAGTYHLVARNTNDLAANTITLTVNAIPIVKIALSNTPAVDAPGYETLSAYATSGTAPYTYNFLVYNSATNTFITNSLQSSNTFTFPIQTAWAGNTIYANAFVKDSVLLPVTVNSVLTGKVTVNPPLAVPTIAASNAVVDAGQSYETFSAFESGGSTPYTYNFLVYNSVTNLVIGNYLTTSNTYTFGVPSYWTTDNLFYSNVIITDSASISANSALASKVTVNSALAVPTIAASNTLTPFAYETLSAYETGGGVLPYTYNFLVYNSITNALITNSLQSSNTFAFAIQRTWSGNTIFANVFVEDSARPPVTANSILTPSVNPQNTLGANVTGSGTVSYYTYATVTFTGTPTQNNQSAWSLYVDGKLYGQTASVISWKEQGLIGNHVLMFTNPGNANYTSYTIYGNLTVQGNGGNTNAGGGGGGVSSGPAPTTSISTTTASTSSTSSATSSASTTVFPTTTVLPITVIPVPINTTIGTAILNINSSSSTPAIITFNSSNATLRVYSNTSAYLPIFLKIQDIAGQIQLPSQVRTISALNISSTTQLSLIEMQMKYPCNTDPNTIAPYKFSNGAWSKISNYTVNSISCSIAFSAPGNTIALALLSGNLTPGIGQYLPYAVAIIVIAVVIVMLLRYFKVMPKRYLRIMLKGKPKQ